MSEKIEFRQNTYLSVQNSVNLLVSWTHFNAVVFYKKSHYFNHINLNFFPALFS